MSARLLPGEVVPTPETQAADNITSQAAAEKRCPRGWKLAYVSIQVHFDAVIF